MKAYFLFINSFYSFNNRLIVQLYLSINCSGVPDSPKLSFSYKPCGAGLFNAKTLETLSPRPPKYYALQL
jgi:hypothetical protein